MILALLAAVGAYELIELCDRIVATRAPIGAPFSAWYSTDAAHRIMSRPGLTRIFVQTLLTAGFFVLFWNDLSSRSAGGAALGAGLRFLVGLLHWYVWPALFQAKIGNERCIGSRFFALEQERLQENAALRCAHDDNACVALHPNDKSFPLGQIDAGNGRLPGTYAYPTLPLPPANKALQKDDPPKEGAPMNTSKTEIVFILDRSGSMATIADDMRGGFDTLIAEQKKVPGECLVTLTQFDNEYEIVYAGKPIADVPKLELVPRGGTALLDAIGRTIAATGERLAKMKEDDRPARVLVAIITDGQENASQEYSQARVAEMIKHQKEAYAWSFIFLGADANAISVAASYGIGAQAAVKYQQKSGGAKVMMRGVSRAMTSSRQASWEGRAAPMVYSQEDYDKDAKAVSSKP